MGGFIHAGHPTYQVAVVGLCQALAAYRCGAITQYEELVETWYALVQAMDRAYPRLSTEVPWDKRTIEAACHHAAHRGAVCVGADHSDGQPGPRYDTSSSGAGQRNDDEAIAGIIVEEDEPPTVDSDTSVSNIWMQPYQPLQRTEGANM